MVRELITQELQLRLSSGAAVYRNPSEEILADRCPCINIFELKDTVEEKNRRTRTSLPIYVRKWFVLLELWIVGSTEESVSVELSTFVDTVRAQLFANGSTLGGTARSVDEVETTYVFRPQTPKMAGIGILLEIKYVEDLNDTD